MHDKILDTFLRAQYEEGMALADASDLLELTPLSEGACDRYLARYLCTGLVRTAEGAIEEAHCFDVAIWFSANYLRRADPFNVVRWVGPREVFHPNISRRLPVICLGRVTPGTPLTDLLYQAFEIITYKKVTMTERDALSFDACVWARENRHRFPVDPRPLKRRRLDLELVPTISGGPDAV